MARQKKPAQVPQASGNGLNYKVSNGEVTILSVVYDQHFDKDGKKDRGGPLSADRRKRSLQVSQGYPVTEIAGGAYANCINMTEVVIPSTVKRVEREAFSGCTSVRSISLPDNGVTICAGVFPGLYGTEFCSYTGICKGGWSHRGKVRPMQAYLHDAAHCGNVTFGEGITSIPKGILF